MREEWYLVRKNSVYRCNLGELYAVISLCVQDLRAFRVRVYKDLDCLAELEFDADMYDFRYEIGTIMLHTAHDNMKTRRTSS